MDTLHAFLAADELGEAQPHRSADETPPPPAVGVPVDETGSRYLTDADASLSTQREMPRAGGYEVTLGRRH